MHSSDSGTRGQAMWGRLPVSYELARRIGLAVPVLADHEQARIEEVQSQTSDRKRPIRASVATVSLLVRRMGDGLKRSNTNC